MNWESIWKENSQEIYRYIYYKVGSREEAEDLTQDTFIRLMRSGKSYDEGPIVGLLKRTAFNLIIDRWRSVKSRAQTVPMEQRILGDEGLGNPERIYIQEEQILQALDALSGDQLLIIRLRLIQGYSVKETAEWTGKTETSVRTLQFRAIRQIQQTLGVHAGQGEELR